MLFNLLKRITFSQSGDWGHGKQIWRSSRSIDLRESLRSTISLQNNPRDGIKLERVPCQQDIPYKVKYRCKFCEMLWLDKLALCSEILATLSLFSLKILPKMEFKTSDNRYKPIKSHWLGNAARSVCRK